MLVHRVRSGEEIPEAPGANGQHQRQANRRPEGVAPADPIPEAEDALGRDPEGRRLLQRRGDRAEMRLHGRLARALHDPAPRRRGVGHGLNGGEGLGSDDEERARRIEPLERVGDVRPIHVRDKMHARSVMVGGERQGRHGGSEIRAADADVDHIGEAPAVEGRDLARAHAVGEGAHRLQHRGDVAHHVPARNENWPARPVAQGRVQHRPALGAVDGLAREHRVALPLHVAGARQRQQGGVGFRRQACLGEIEQHVVQPQGETPETVMVAREQAAHGKARGLSAQVSKACPESVDGHGRGVPRVKERLAFIRALRPRQGADAQPAFRIALSAARKARTSGLAGGLPAEMPITAMSCSIRTKARLLRS